MSVGSLCCNQNIAVVFSMEGTILRAMKSGTLSRCVATLLLAGFSLGLHAEVRDNPYQIIIQRNPFALNPIPPPPPPQTNAVVEEKPQVDIKITGISTLLGAPKVFLQVQNQQTKKTEFVTITQGDPKDGLELLAVDPDAGSVRVRQADGTELDLDFERNGVKPTGGAVASAVPMPPPPGGGGVVPLNRPAPAPLNFNNPGSSAIVNGGGGMNSASMPTPNANAAFPGAVNNMPTRDVRASMGNNVIVTDSTRAATPTTPQPTVNTPQLSREEVMARIEAQRQILLQKEQQGLAPANMSRILPPTPYSPPPAPTPR
jgi:hypothetical protein